MTKSLRVIRMVIALGVAILCGWMMKTYQQYQQPETLHFSPYVKVIRAGNVTTILDNVGGATYGYKTKNSFTLKAFETEEDRQEKQNRRDEMAVDTDTIRITVLENGLEVVDKKGGVTWTKTNWRIRFSIPSLLDKAISL